MATPSRSIVAAPQRRSAPTGPAARHHPTRARRAAPLQPTRARCAEAQPGPRAVNRPAVPCVKPVTGVSVLSSGYYQPEHRCLGRHSGGTIRTRRAGPGGGSADRRPGLPRLRRRWSGRAGGRAPRGEPVGSVTGTEHHPGRQHHQRRRVRAGRRRRQEVAERYWAAQFKESGLRFRPIRRIIPYQRDGEVSCGGQPLPRNNAAYCSAGDFIAYDVDWSRRGVPPGRRRVRVLPARARVRARIQVRLGIN